MVACLRWRLVAILVCGALFLATAVAPSTPTTALATASQPSNVAAEPGTSQPVSSAQACRIVGDKTASPARLTLGETAQVELSIAVVCPDRPPQREADIALVMDRSASMRGAPLQAAKEAARTFLGMLNGQYHRVGLVSYATDVVLELDLTSDIERVSRAVGWLQAEGYTNLAGAVAGGTELLRARGRHGVPWVMVLLSDGVATVGNDPLVEASNARLTGVEVYTIGLGAAAADVLRAIATKPENFLLAPTPADLSRVYTEVAERIVTSRAGNLVVRDDLAAFMDYVAGSAVPPGESGPATFEWRRPDLPSQPWRLRYVVRPTRVGLWPVNDRAVAEYDDANGDRHEYVFPVPYIEVVAPATVGRCRPTVYLPFASLSRCVRKHVPTDVVLMIDVSGSMAEGNKIVAARQAAETFVRLLSPGQDRAGVILFSCWSRTLVELSGDLELVARSVQSVDSPAGATALDTPLVLAAQMLSGRSDSHRPAVGILLTDGLHNGPGSVYDAAATFKATGARLFTIGLGGDADHELLRTIAHPNSYRFAPTGAELESIYREIAEVIDCG